MYHIDPIYDIDALAGAGLHIHTAFSGCAKPEMTLPSIVEAAESAGLHTIALTDHYNDNIDDAEFLRRAAVLRAQAAELDTRLVILFGGELSAYAVGKTLEGQAVRDALDFRLYSANHYHLDFWEQPEDTSARGYALHSLRNVASLLRSGKPDCVAHPLVGGYIRALDDPCEMTALITDSELGDLLTLARETETAFELNVGAVKGDPALARRMWNIGREVGVSFTLGTDAHRLAYIDPHPELPEIKRILGA